MNGDLESRSELERRAREVFDAGVESLDGRERARLARARHEALGSIRVTKELRVPRWIPATALASAALVAVLLWRMPAPELEPVASGAAPTAAIESVDMLANAEDFDLVSNDLAFYEWLDSTGLAAAGGTS
jgi:hypothetical protein